jgi:WD40 repeat protein
MVRKLWAHWVVWTWLLGLMGLNQPLIAGESGLLGEDADRQVQAILSHHCSRCHGDDGSIEGGFNFVGDLRKLLARGKIIAGQPDMSPLFRRMAEGSMPPPEEQPRPSAADLALLRRWIAQGAKLSGPATTPSAISPTQVQEWILADLERFERRARRFQRYFTLNHLANAGLGESELQTHRNALAKLLNSLSWHPEIRNPVPVDPRGTVLRIDLRWYMWDAALWNLLLEQYPYGIQDDSAVSRAVMVSSGTRMPVVRADWFVATASRAPLYYDLLQLPGNLAELERQLRVDANLNIQQDRVMRLAFNGSGVSRFNRILERHPSIHGAYWRTYDFNEPPQNLLERGTLLPDRRNVFAHPLGPGLVDEPFQHAGGEVIFSLPNGLHGYYLCNEVNDRLDKGPQAIVSDPRRPDRAVECAVSCMGCHVTGILPKADQMHDHLTKNPTSFRRADAERIRALYPPKEESLARMAEDAKVYAAALAKTGNKVAKTESVLAITRQYEADLDLARAAAEVGWPPEKLQEAIAEFPALTRNLGGLRVTGGTVSRQVWLQTFGDLTRDLRLGTLFQANITAGQNSDATADADPLEQSGAMANQVVFSLDGRRALVAAADRSVRYWDVEARRDLKILVGHTGSVWSVAFHPVASLGLSGGIDGTVRLWDLSTGSERKRIEAHESLVSTVVFSRDGNRAISGGYDGTVRVWEVGGSGSDSREVQRFEPGFKYVHALDWHPRQPLLAVAADRGVWLWNPNTGEVARHWQAHDSAVTSVRFSPDGGSLVSGGDDGRVRLWETRTGNRLADWVGHSGSVRNLDWHPSGKWLLSAASDRTVRLWQVGNPQEVAVFRKHAAGLLAGSFLPSGKRTVSIDRELGTQFWDIGERLSSASSPPQPAITPMTDPLERIPVAQ